jgi:aspartyl-tRNA(Asn)/glutamyl-tRNA(Gln) amidotransferase subunit C
MDIIQYLEDLSKLKLTEEEAKTAREDLLKILEYMSSLNKIDTTGVEEMSHPFSNVNDFREDKISASYPRELILKNAPKKNGEYFIAPKTVE